MKRSIILFISIIFVFVTIISVTFGMWTISNSNGGFQNFISKAEKAINTNEFIYYDTTKGNGEGIDCFSYYKTGFLNSDGSLSTKGTLKVYYIIDFDKAKQEFGEYDNLNLYISLQNGNNSNSTKFNSFLQNVTTNVYKNSETTPLTITNYSALITFTKDQLNSLSGTQTLEISFEFSASTTGSSFESNIYNNLKDINFKVETKAEGANN